VPAPERLFFARCPVERRVQVLRASLAWEKNDLFGAYARRIDVHDDFQAGAVQLTQPEVGHFDLCRLGGAERDTRASQNAGGPLLGFLDLRLRQHAFLLWPVTEAPLETAPEGRLSRDGLSICSPNERMLAIMLAKSSDQHRRAPAARAGRPRAASAMGGLR
jgi:hypothetical protein